MNSERIKKIASLISKEDKVLDIGCDHCYLGIYLIKNKILNKIIASDIHEKVLESAKLNVQKYNYEKNIKLILTDGFNNINEYFDTVVMAGMGTNTILHILATKNDNIKKLIIQSNNDLYLLRNELYKKGFYLDSEIVLYEKKHYYIVGCFTKNYRKYQKREMYFGLYNENYKEYYHYLYNKLKEIKKYKPIKEKINILYQMYLLKKYL